MKEEILGDFNFKLKFTTKILKVILLIPLILVQFSLAYDLSGEWVDSFGTIAFIAQSGTRLTVSITGSGPPYQGHFLNSNQISVNFIDNPGCCTARIEGNGRILRWSNQVVWSKL